ncbi:MAG: phosphoglycerate dehydrogenase, partial [Candidatus Hadarchaeota archaeon]
MAKDKGSILVTPRSYRSLDGPHWDMLDASPYEVIRSPHTDSLMTEEEMIEMVSEEDIRGIVIGLDPVTRDVIESASDLEIVAKYGTGLDNIDLEAADEAGVHLTWTVGANSQSVADLAFGFILALARWIPAHDRYLREGSLQRNQGTEVFGKTLGIIGLGQIGSLVAKRAKGFNMEVIFDGYGRSNKSVQFIQERILDAEYRDFDDLLKTSDFVTLHCPLTESSRKLISYDELSMMSEDAFLINTARKSLVDEEALVDALENEEIAGAAMDTFDEEEHLGTELLEFENFIGAP